mmetsp:Transcript_19152/g.48665  ORF Transcript_19152/g.48665 Transcript_19152/m.48665 type:complete len:166 (+) Transcript_19152:41-538(+)
MGKHGAAGTTKGQYPSLQEQSRKRANKLKHKSRDAKRARAKLEDAKTPLSGIRDDPENWTEERLRGYSDWEDEDYNSVTWDSDSDSPDNDEESERTEEDIAVQCCCCKKWRRLPADNGDDLNIPWFCCMHPDPAWNRCSVTSQAWPSNTKTHQLDDKMDVAAIAG